MLYQSYIAKSSLSFRMLQLAIQTATSSSQVAGVGTRKKNVEQKFSMDKHTNFLEKNYMLFICEEN